MMQTQQNRTIMFLIEQKENGLKLRNEKIV